MKKKLKKIDDFIHKMLQVEKDKWNSGLKNNYYSMYDLVEDIEEVLDKWERRVWTKN